MKRKVKARMHKSRFDQTELLLLAFVTVALLAFFAWSSGMAKGLSLANFSH
ncbi:MAG: hypothetical protein M1484_02915 [Patescibacteria group bacterium]|nr:hypothetical protein [Patescibacteria group bacterium]